MTAHVNVFINVVRADQADLATQLVARLSTILGKGASVAILDAPNWDLCRCDYCDVVLSDEKTLDTAMEHGLRWTRERKNSVSMLVVRAPGGHPKMVADATVDVNDLSALLQAFDSNIRCWGKMKVSLSGDLIQAAREILISARATGLALPGIDVAGGRGKRLAARRNATYEVNNRLDNAYVVAIIPEAIAHLVSKGRDPKDAELDLATTWRTYSSGFPIHRRKVQARHVHARSLAHVMGETGPRYRLAGRLANPKPTVLLTDLASDDPVRAIVRGLCSDLIDFAADADLSQPAQAVDDEVAVDAVTQDLIRRRSKADALPRFHRIDMVDQLVPVLDAHDQGAPEGIILVGCPTEYLADAKVIAAARDHDVLVLPREDQPLDALRETDRHIRAIIEGLTKEMR